jgi:hypothetical protein
VLSRPLDSALVALNQWLPIGSSLRELDVRGLVASAVSDPVGPGMLILENEHRKAQSMILRGVSTASIQTLGPTRAGVLSAELTSPRDRLELTVAPNSVLAVSPSS